MKESEDTGTGLPLGTVLCVIFIRFILWPAISIPLVWALATYTSILPNDPILYFTLMIMPVGPTAMKVLALADVSGASQKVRMSIAKFLTVSNMIYQKIFRNIGFNILAFLRRNSYNIFCGCGSS